MFGIGLAEIFVVLVVAVLVIGPAQLPEAAASIGKLIRSFKRLYYEIKRDVYDQPFKNDTYQPKQKNDEAYILPEGVSVPDLIEDDLEEEVASAQPKKSVKESKKKSTAKSKKKKKDVSEKEVVANNQLYLLPDDGPFGRGTDMEDETDLFSHAKKEDS